MGPGTLQWPSPGQLGRQRKGRGHEGHAEATETDTVGHTVLPHDGGLPGLGGVPGHAPWPDMRAGGRLSRVAGPWTRNHALSRRLILVMAHTQRRHGIFVQGRCP